MTVDEAKAFLKMAGWTFENKRGGYIDARHATMAKHGLFAFSRGYKRTCEDVLHQHYNQIVELEK